VPLVASLLVTAIHSTLLCGVAWLASAALGARLPHLRLALWLLVLLRLVLPPAVMSPWTPVAMPSVFDAPELTAVEGDDGAAAEPSAPHADVHATLFAAGWAAGALLLFARWRLLRARHVAIVAAAEDASPAARAIADDWRRRLGIRRPVRLLVSTAHATPFTIGVLRPAVVLPSSYDGDELSIVIGHELAHVRRLDDLWLTIEAALRCLFFVHPAAWLATARLRDVREQLADELLLDRARDASLGRRVARTLLAAAAPAGDSFAVAAFGTRASASLARRIRRLLAHAEPRRKRLGIAAGIAAGAFLLPMALPAQRPSVDAGALAHPLPGARITSPFGARQNPWSNARDVHQGIDLAAPRGTAVHAAADGNVVVATERYAPSPTHGAVVIVQHANGLTTFYSHLDAIDVRVGQRVARGDVIGRVGTTGRVTGPHLHFELRTPRGPIDPSPRIFLNARRVRD